MKYRSSFGLGAAVICLTSAVSVARADNATLSDATLVATGEPYTKNIVDKLITLKVGAKCMARLGDKDGGALHAASSVTRGIERWAKRVSSESWSDIEGADKEKNQALVAGKIAEFRSKFSMTIDVEGDDCDNGFSALWPRYWNAIVTAMNDYPIDGAKLNITLKVRKAARVVTYVVSPDHTTIEFTAPRDIESSKGLDVLQRPFRQINSGFSNDFAYATFLATDFTSATVLDQLVSIKAGPACLAKLPDPDQGAVHAASFFARDISNYAQAVTGDDWSQIETQSNGTRESNRKLVAEMIGEFRKRFQFSIIIDGADCETVQNANWLRYTTTIATALRNNPPTTKKLTIELRISKSAKDIKVTVSKDGQKISYVGPPAVEPKDWGTKLEKPFAKFPRSNK